MKFNEYEAKSTGTFVNCPPGIHNAILAEVKLQRDVENKFGDPDPVTGKLPLQNKFIFTFQTEQQMDDGRPFSVHCWLTASTHEKSNIVKYLESWNGRAFTDQERNNLDTDDYIGRQCTLQIMARTNNPDKTDIKAIMPVQNGATKLSIWKKDDIPF